MRLSEKTFFEMLIGKQSSASAMLTGKVRYSGEGDFAFFYLKAPGKSTKHKKMGFFSPMRPWNWTIGAMIGFGEIETEAEKKID